MAQWHRIHDAFDDTTIYVLRDANRVYAETLEEPTAQQSKETADIWGIVIDDGIVDVEAFMGDEEPEGIPAGMEVFYRTAAENEADEWVDDEGEAYGEGWYYWACFPGCMPDSAPFGPYATEEEAIADLNAWNC